MVVTRKLIAYLLLLLFVFPLAARASWFAFQDRPRSWRDADWSSAGLLPRAADAPDARILVFAGRTGGLKGAVAVHSWIVLKHANAGAWMRYDVVGWGNPVRQDGWAADARWYGGVPSVVADVRGAEAAALIPKLEAAIADYPYARSGDYRLWPGPNSNTFVATALRAVPELGAVLPPNAVGKDFRGDGFYAGLTDSRTGIEINLAGILGLKIGWVEGIELNVLGLVAGLDIRQPAVKLPGFGRLGLALPSSIDFPAVAVTRR
jgi:hypothetical protein